MEIVVESAKPILDKTISSHTFNYYVKSWVVSGYTWNGECMCSRKDFTNLEVDLGNELTVSKLTISHKLNKLNKISQIF